MLSSKQMKKLIDQILDLLPNVEQKAEIEKNLNSLVDSQRINYKDMTDPRLASISREVNYAIKLIEENTDDWKSEAVELIRNAEIEQTVGSVSVDIDVDKLSAAIGKSLGSVIKQAIIEAYDELFSEDEEETESTSSEPKSSKKTTKKRRKK